MKKLYSFFVLFALLFCYTGNVWGQTTVLSESFDNGDFDSKWERRNNISNTQVYSTGAHTGSYGFRFYYNTNPPQYLISKTELSIPAGSEVNLSVYYKAHSSQYVESFQVGYSTTNNETNSFNWIPASEIKTSSTSWAQYSTDELPANTKYIAFRYTANDKFAVYIDDILVTYTTPSCSKPSITSADIYDVNASFTWTAGKDESQWQYLYLPAATTLTDSHWDAATLTSSTSATINGLTKSTDYVFYLRSFCSADDQSKVVSYSFTTACSVIETLPDTTKFDGTNGTLPECWTKLRTTDQAYDASIYNGELRFSGNNSSSYKSRKIVLILPKTKADITTLKVSFTYKNGGSTTSYPQFQIGYVTDIKNIESFNLVQAVTRNSTAGSESGDISFEGAASGSYIAICYNNPNGGTSSNYSYIDNFVVKSVQDCSAPQNVALSGSSISTADFSWDANTGVDSYKYCVVAQGEDADWSGDLTANTNSAHVESLTPGNYTFYVKCACGTAATSLDFEIVSCPSVTGVTLSNQLWNAVTVNWTTSATTNCDVQYKIGDGLWTAYETNLSATSKTFTGLVPGTTYSFRVKPNCSADGWVSPESSYTPTCPTPGALTFSDETYNGVTVSWDPIEGVNAWNLQYQQGELGWVSVTENPLTSTTYTFTDLVTNAEYSFQVQAECESWSPVANYTPVYEIPAVATVSSIKDVTASASWSSVTGATGYQYSCVPAGNAASWSETIAGNGPIALSGLTAAESYDFSVRAVFGVSGYSAPKVKNFTTVCQAPTSLVKGATTSSSLAFSWSKSANGVDNRYQYVCKEGSSAPTDDQWANDAVLLDEGVRAATVEGLKSNTTYYFFVRSYYGDGKYSSAINTYNTTDCGIVSIGWKEDFEYSGSFPTCWDKSHYSYWGSSYIWKVGSGYGCIKSGTYSIMIDSYKYTSTSYTADLETPSISINEKADLRYYWYTESGVPYKIFLKVNGVETQLKNFSAAAHSWNNVEVVSIPDTCVGKTFTLIFRAQSAGVNSSRKLYIDSLSLVYRPIIAPTSLAATSTADGADVTWDAEEGPYDLQYRVNGSSDAWTTVSNIADKNYTIEGLTEQEYEVQVRAHASEHRISAWTESQTFTPEACPTVTAVTLSEKTYNSVTIGCTLSAVGTWDLQYKAGSGDWTDAYTNIATATKEFAVSVGTTYSFRAKPSCRNAWTEADETYAPAYPTPASVEVATTEVTATGSWAAIDGATGYEYIVVAKDAPQDWTSPSTATTITAGIVTAASVANLNGGTEYDFYVRAVFGVNSGNATKASFTTDKVAPTTLVKSTATANSITFSWSYSGAVNQFQWKTSKAGSQWSAVQSDESATATDLESGTTYTIYVRTYYADGIYSDELSGSMNTECASKSIGYSTNFDAESALPACWESTNFGSGNNQWNIGMSWYECKSSWNSARFLAYKNSESATSDLITPAIDLTESAMLKFFYLKNSTDVVAQVLIRIPGENDEVIWTATTKSQWATIADSVDLSSYVGKTAKLIFRAYGSTTNTTRYFYLDDVSFAYKHCAKPTGLTASATIATMKGAEITWVDNKEEGPWDLRYRTNGVGEWTAVNGITAKNYRLTGLDAVEYEVQVRTHASAHRISAWTDSETFTPISSVTLNDNEDNTATLNTLLGQNVDITINRTIYCDGDYNTLCLPFSLATLAGTPLEDATVYAYKYAVIEPEELLVRIYETENGIQAGVPYLLTMPTGSDITSMTFSDVTITAAEGQTIGKDEAVEFIGILKPQPFTAGDETTLFVSTENNLAWANTDANLYSFRAYFNRTAVAGAPLRPGMRARIVVQKEVATGVDGAQGNGVQCIKLIENEQLVIIRDGVKYNVQGQIIR